MAPLLLDQNVKPSVSAEEPRVSLHDFLHTERVLALTLIIVVALYIRARDPLYSTAYMDESVYVVYGRMFLMRRFEVARMSSRTKAIRVLAVEKPTQVVACRKIGAIGSQDDHLDLGIPHGAGELVVQSVQQV